VPVPAALLDALDLVHGLRDRATRSYLWTWSLKTAYTRVIEIMAQAGIAGPQASPKGLRHGFGVACIEKGIPLNLVQRWLGHAQLSTTAIYADAVGEEERHIAARLWT
jgi:site-specific recombinase XerD